MNIKFFFVYTFLSSFQIDVESSAVGIAPGMLAPPPTANCPVRESSYLVTGDDTLSEDTVVSPAGERPSSSTSGESLKSVESTTEAGTVGMATETILDESNRGQIPETDDLQLPENQGDPNGENVVVNGAQDETEADLETVNHSKNDYSQTARIKVKFDDIDNEGDRNYNAPLITSEQLALPGEDLTELIFCKHFSPSISGSTSSANEAASRSYVECSDRVLEQGVEQTLISYNIQAASSFKKRINFVAFREALHHAAHLSRALVSILTCTILVCKGCLECFFLIEVTIRSTADTI